MQDLLTELGAILKTAPEQLRAAGPSGATPAGQWNRSQILGHLIDSASNNHLRFVSAQVRGEVRLPSYEQEQWVFTQGYDQEDWEQLVTLWTLYNRHLLHVIERIDPARLDVVCYIGNNPPMTLKELVYDYLSHLKHHLADLPVTLTGTTS